MDLTVVNEKEAILEVNFEEVRANLQQKLDFYKGLIVTEDTLPQAKSSQKELAGLRTEIDRFRKDKKADMEKPIKEFEAKCKELLQLVDEVEAPLKDAIKGFDDQTREEKRKIAQEIIDETIKDYGLREKFAEKLTIESSYLNLTASKKAVKNDVNARAIALQALQMAEDGKVQAIKAVLEGENVRLTAKMDISEYQPLIDRGFELSEIITQIRERAERTYKAENGKGEEPPKEAPITEQKTEEADNRIYFIAVKLVGKKEAIQGVSKAIKDSGISYTVLDQGVIE